MGDGERCHLQQHRPQPACQQKDAEHEQNVIETVGNDVRESK